MFLPPKNLFQRELKLEIITLKFYKKYMQTFFIKTNILTEKKTVFLFLFFLVVKSFFQNTFTKKVILPPINKYLGGRIKISKNHSFFGG